MVKLSWSVDQRYDFSATNHRGISCAIACTLRGDTCLLYSWKYPCNTYLGDSEINCLVLNSRMRIQIPFLLRIQLIWRNYLSMISTWKFFLQTRITGFNEWRKRNVSPGQYPPLFWVLRTVKIRVNKIISFSKVFFMLKIMPCFQENEWCF